MSVMPIYGGLGQLGSARPANQGGANRLIQAMAKQRQPANGGLSQAQVGSVKANPSKGGLVAPKAPAAPGAGGASPAGQALTAKPEVRDSTYWAGIANNDFIRGNELAAIKTKTSRLDEDTTSRLGQLAKNLVLTDDNIAESENKSNLFGSGHMQKLTDEAGYQNKLGVDATNLAHDRGHQDADTETTSIIGQYGDPTKAGDEGIAGAGLYADAGSRWLAAHPGGTPTGSAYDSHGNLVPQGFDDSVDGGESLHQQLIDSKGGQAAPKTTTAAPSARQPAGGGLSPAQKAQAQTSKGGMVRPK